MTKQQTIGLLILTSLLWFYLRNRQRIIINNIIDDLPKHSTKTYTQRNLNQIDKIILHHYASNGTPQSVARYHVNTRDWAGIGYHFTINKDGTISQVNRLDTISYHTSGQNTVSIGVALEGNFEHEQPTQAQMKSLNQLIPYIRNQVPQKLQVYQHSDFANKPHDASLNLQPYKLAGIFDKIPKNKDEIDFQMCNDGKVTDNFEKGACSHHGGVEQLKDLVSDADIESLFFKEYTIIEFLQGTKISIDSFLEYGNRDYLRNRLNFLRKNGTPLDDAAQQLENRYNQSYDVQEIVDIIEEYSSPSDAMNDLRERTFEHLKRFSMNGIEEEEGSFFDDLSTF